MNKQAYSKTYNKSKQALRDAINAELKRMSPERLTELQTKAHYELEHPPEHPITRYSLKLPKLDTDTIISQFRNGRKDTYVHTKDMFGDVHLYFELLRNPEDAVEVLTRRHPKFAERSEKITNMTPCVCPLCTST